MTPPKERHAVVTLGIPLQIIKVTKVNRKILKTPPKKGPWWEKYDSPAPVGAIVYEHYSPGRYGVVVKNKELGQFHDKSTFQVITVRWLVGKKKGMVVTMPCHYVQPYERLVLEHERKGKRHRKIMEDALKEVRILAGNGEL